MKPTTISIEKFKRRLAGDALSYGHDMLLLDHVRGFEMLAEPCRIDAVTVLICLGGSLDCSINLNRHHIEGTGILVSYPDNILMVERSRDVEAYAIMVSSSFVGEMQVDPSLRVSTYIRLRHHPLLNVTAEEIRGLKGYYDLLSRQMLAPNDNSGVIVASLARALMYTLRSLDHTIDDGRGSRELQQFEAFMTLLQTHHDKHRRVSFYADRMCLSANYLSAIVKQSSGKTAGEWIDEWVIQEAKSLLRFSGLTVQEVAYRLNFPTQSAFGKYFKSKVGLSPKHYSETLDIRR